LMLPVALILVSVVFVARVLGSNLLHRSPAIDKNTLCRKDVPLENHTVLVIDATDAFTRDQAARLRASVADERAVCIPKTLSVLLTWWNRLSWRNDRAALFRSCRPGLAIQVEGAA
jgi:hypothetical protein